jgi:hypothetical protein
MSSGSSEELAQAITETIRAGAKVINLSAALANSSLRGEHQLEQAWDYAPNQRRLVGAPGIRCLSLEWEIILGGYKDAWNSSWICGAGRTL